MTTECGRDDPGIDLMLRVKAGDETAFDELVRRFRRPLAGFFYSLCWNYEAAQDYAQETLVRIWLARDRYEPRASFATYLFRVARNHWANALRTRSRRPRSMSMEAAWEPEMDGGDVERVLIRRYQSARIRRAIAELPEHYRLVFTLCHFEALKCAEVAEILEIPVGTVKSRMSSAVRLLRTMVGDDIL